MGKPCGCAGSCGCDIRGRKGVRVSGSGIAPDTMWIELDGSSPDACNTIMDCVGANVLNGLVYNAGTRKLSVRLSSGTNQISFGPDGGLLVTGAGGGGGAGGQTVANLPTGTNTIIGGTWGAGSALWAEGTHQALTAAASLAGTALRMVHIPLRRTSDLLPICLAEGDMAWYLRNGVTQSPSVLDHREHSACLIKAADEPPGADAGFFGFYEPSSLGSPTLAETFRVLGRRAVLVLEVRDTASPGDTADRVKEVGPQFDVMQSIIVAGEPVPSTGLNGPTILEAVSASMVGSGVPIGVVFRTRQQVIDYPPSRLNTLGVTWVFVDKNLVDTTVSNHVSTEVTAYRTAGLNVMLHGVHRQYQTARAAALQLRGALCTDPLYAYGAASAYRYRKDTASWNWTTPNVGQHSPWSDTVIGQGAHYRGILFANEPGMLTLAPDLHNPEQVEPYPSGYWMLAGEQLPLRNADTYAIQTFFRWDSLPSDRGRWAGLFFDCPTDRSVRDWSAATAQTVGYLLVMSVGSGTSTFSLVEYDGTPGQPPESRVLMNASVGYNVVAGGWYGIRAEVTPTQIRVYASSSAWPSAFAKVLVGTINNPHRYISGVNNGSFFFGRHFFTNSDARIVKVAGLKVEYTGF